MMNTVTEANRLAAGVPQDIATVVQSKSVILATLKQCGKAPKGCRTDTGDRIVALLIKSGLLVVRNSGLVAITVKGREALHRAAHSSKKKSALKPRQRVNLGAATINRTSQTTRVEGAVILAFRRR
jgi:hypothetical protein